MASTARAEEPASGNSGRYRTIGKRQGWRETEDGPCGYVAADYRAILGRSIPFSVSYKL